MFASGMGPSPGRLVVSAPRRSGSVRTAIDREGDEAENARGRLADRQASRKQPKSVSAAHAPLGRRSVPARIGRDSSADAAGASREGLPEPCGRLLAPPVRQRR